MITVVLNNKEHVEDCICSVLGQTYRNIEYIVIDGGSTDGTLGVIRGYETSLSVCVSEPDRGIYDAMNKGIACSSGDVVGILNSDDIYADESVLEKVVGCFLNNQVDACYGDLMYVDRKDVSKTIRDWKSKPYKRENFRKGWMPPHPAFFVRREMYDRHGAFNLDFPLAADYELMLRFLYVKNLSIAYIPEYLIRMRAGGNSRPGVVNTLKNMKENYRAWKVNGLKAQPLTFLVKPLSKMAQYVKKTK